MLPNAAMPGWLEHDEHLHGALREELKARLLAISPAQIDRLLGPAAWVPVNWA